MDWNLEEEGIRPLPHDDGEKGYRDGLAAECEGERQFQTCRDEKIDKGEREKELPAQIKQLVDPDPRGGPAQKDGHEHQPHHHFFDC